MEQNFSANDVYEFLKLLIETGDVHYVDADHCIYRTEDRTPVGVKVGNGKDCNKVIALFKEGTKPPANSVYLNPFVELLGNHPEVNLFLNTISVIPGCIALHTMKTMAEMITSKSKDVKPKQAQAFAKYVDKVDNKFVDEIQKIRPLDVGMIFYDKDKKVAQLLCDLWQDEFADKMKSKIRKSTLTTIREMAEDLFKTKTPEEMMHTATLLACPKFDATVHVMIEALTRMSPIVEKITKMNLHVDELNEHVKHLEAYHKAIQWLATSSASSVKATSEIDSKIDNAASAVPWNVCAPGTLNNNGGILGNAVPAVVGQTVRNPTFPGATTIRNPTFGLGALSMNAVDPGIPGLGRVAPVVPTVTADFSNISVGGGFGGGMGFGGGFGRMF